MQKGYWFLFLHINIHANKKNCIMSLKTSVSVHINYLCVLFATRHLALITQ